MSMPGGRLPEPRAAVAPSHLALMDQVYRHQRHFYDLTRRHYLFGRDRLIGGMAAKPGQRILEIGCGTARNLIKIARRYPGTELWGVDASGEMLRTARQSVAGAALGGRIRLCHGLAEDIPQLFAAGSPFDHVVFSYSLSMIADWQAALRASSRVARAEARIHLVDFADFGALWPWAAGSLRFWLRLFHVTPRDELVLKLQQLANGRQDCTLDLLSGRYAFVFKASIGAIADLA
jgi:S-adenosylmethionine-diacylgycerolhomoserine-N-methlytransferase